MGKFLASFTFFCIISGAFAASDTPARVTAVDGPVIFEQGEGAEWAEAALYQAVFPSDRYVLQEGAYLEIELNDGSFARLGPKSDIVVEELSLESSRLALHEGALILRTETDSLVTVNVGQVRASVRGVGLSRIELTPQGNVNVTSRFGTVELTDGIRTRTLSRGQHLEHSPNGLLASTLGFGFPLDDLDQWSDERDARLVASGGGIYGGESVPGYFGDSGALGYGNQGVWGGYGGYGHSWSPYFGFGPSSFHRADFRFYPGLGFGFCAFEPWGFSPAFAWSPFYSHFTYNHWAYVRPLSRWCRMSSFYDWRYNRFGFRPTTTWAGPGPSAPPDGGPVQAGAPTEPPGFFPTRPLDWTAARSLELPPAQTFSQSPVMQPFDNWIPFQPENPTQVLAPPADPALRSLQPLGESPIAITPYPRGSSGPATAPAGAGPPERSPSDASPLGGAAPATRALEGPQAQPQNPAVIVIPRRATPETPSTGPAPRALTPPPSRERSPNLAPPENRPTPQIQRIPSRERIYPQPEPQGRPLVVVPRQAPPERPATAPPQRSLNPPSLDRTPGLRAPQTPQAPQIQRPAQRPTPQVQRPQQRPVPQVRPVTPQRAPQVRPQQPRPTPPRPAAQPAQQRRPQERSGPPPQ
jgi:hypothetical protein